MNAKFVLAAMLMVGAVSLAGGTATHARPVVSARITSVDIAAGGANASVQVKASCAVGWSADAFTQRLVVRQESGGQIVNAYKTDVGSSFGWTCDGEEHLLAIDLVADGTWQPGSAKVIFDATVWDGTNMAVDFPTKRARVR